MATFRDCKGQEWHARVTIGTLRDLEEAVGFPILEAISNPERFTHEIVGRVDVVAKGLYFACQEDAAARRIGYAEFEKLISGPAVANGIKAFMVSLIECFPQPEENKAARPTKASLGPGKPFTVWQRLRALFRHGRIR